MLVTDCKQRRYSNIRYDLRGRSPARSFCRPQRDLSPSAELGGKKSKKEKGDEIREGTQAGARI